MAKIVIPIDELIGVMSCFLPAEDALYKKNDQYLLLELNSKKHIKIGSSHLLISSCLFELGSLKDINLLFKSKEAGVEFILKNGLTIEVKEIVYNGNLKKIEIYLKIK